MRASDSRTKPDGAGMRVAIVASRWNDVITDRLVEGALQCLKEHQVAEDDVTLCWVPGAFELPLIAQQLARSDSVDAIVALGCVIRGETDHYVHIATQVAAGLSRVALDESLPVAFGVLTTDDLAQADARALSGLDNKGYEAALTAIEQFRLVQSVRET